MRFVLLIKNPIPLSRPRRYKKKTIENDERIDAGVIFLEKKILFLVIFRLCCRYLSTAGRCCRSTIWRWPLQRFRQPFVFCFVFLSSLAFLFLLLPPHRWPAGVIAERLSIEGERERETKQLGNTR